MLQKIDYIGYLYAYDKNIGIKDIKTGKYNPTLDISTIKNYMDKEGIRCMVYGGSYYHDLFLSFLPSPYILYTQGDLSLLDKKHIAIIGPRLMSSYAKKVLDELFGYLAQYDNVVIVSGCAPGVDIYCHELSLEYKIPTIAVLGGGIAYYHTTGKHFLLEKIVASGGLLLSEYKLWQTPQKYTFPLRNRIIAGIADCIFLPEASHKSGSLITVDYGIKYSKPIYAPMNDIFIPTSAGTNHYISEGSIIPLSTLEGFLDTYFQKKQLPALEAILPKKVITKKEVLLHTSSPENILITRTMQELGL